MIVGFNSGNNTLYLTNFSLTKVHVVLKLDSNAKEVLKIWYLKNQMVDTNITYMGLGI
jgi:hypothetical protein